MPIDLGNTMQIYQHILVAVDFIEQSHAVLDKARQLAACHKADLSLVHVVENMVMPDPGYGMDTVLEVDLTTEMLHSAQSKLAELGKKLGIPDERCWVELGSPKYEVTRIAEENGVDLIVVGSHGRHGLALLLGSNADGVLHHAKCDMLAVRLPDN
jgi:universal stress protein A